MRALISKILTSLIFIRYPRIPAQQRWFIRFSIKGWLYQLRFFYKDYILKKPYKIIEFKGEFQQELIKVLPHAYWHYKNGTLLKTQSPKYMAPFYFFSPSHTEIYETRDYLDNYNLAIPNSAHSTFVDKSKWLRVPLKEHYQNTMFAYSKPSLVIANRYNTEWEGEPVSYFDIDTLKFILDKLVDNYQIIYNRPDSQHLANDSSKVLELNDREFIKDKYGKSILLMQDLYDIHSDKLASLNHLQLMVYANCKNFISIHGGTATLASYFGGKNLIYSRSGHEHFLSEFEKVFSQLANTQVFVAKDNISLKEKVSELF